MTEDEKKRVIEFVEKNTVEDGDCLIWTGRLSNSGGLPKIKNKSARREHFQATQGEVKPGYLVTSACERKLCMAHLKQVPRAEVSRKQNMDPAVRAKKRASSARAAREKAKISMDIARQMRESTDTIDVEAAKWGVDRTLVSRVRRNQAWREDACQASPFAGLFSGLVAANDGRKRA